MQSLKEYVQESLDSNESMLDIALVKTGDKVDIDTEDVEKEKPNDV